MEPTNLALGESFAPLTSAGQELLLLAEEPACASAVMRLLAEETGFHLSVAPGATDPDHLIIGDGIQALVVAGAAAEDGLLSLIESLASARPDLPIVVVIDGLDENTEAELIVRGAGECRNLRGLDGAGLARSLRRSILRHKRSVETRRHSDATLEAVKLSLLQAQRAGHVGIWEWDIVSGELWFSDEALRILGIPARTGAVSYERFLAAVHAEDRALVEEAMAGCLCGLAGYHIERRVQWPDGSVRIVRQQGEVACDDEGRPARMVGTMLDVTARRQAELALQESQDELERRVQERTRVLLQEVAQRQRAEAVVRQSEQRVRAITDALPGMIAYIDKNRRFQFANRRHQEWLGVTPNDLLNRHIRQVMGEVLYRTLEGHVDAVLEGREVSYDGQMRVQDGSLRAYQATHIPHRGADGDVLGYFSLVLDVTERRRAEEGLRRSEEKYRALMNDAADAILLADSVGRLIEGNRRAEELLGFPAGGLTGSSLLDILIEAERPRGHGWFNDLVASGAATLLDTQVRTRLGGTLPVDVAATAVTIDGNLIYQASIKDISDHRRAEEQLRSAKEAAELADRAKSEFLANMSHELRTPLNAIIGFSDIMRSELLGPVGTEAYRGYVEDIHVSGRHLLEVINEILDMSKVEAGHIELLSEPVNLGNLARASLRLIRERADEGRVTLINDIPDSLPQVFVDERRFKQILLNLLSNAVKFTPVNGSIRIAAEVARGGGMTVSVTDTGIGMSEDDLGKALAPFGQVESSLSRRFDGTGLGLPLTKAFVELHDGRLELRSTPGQGTSVLVHLPRHRVLA